MSITILEIALPPSAMRRLGQIAVERKTPVHILAAKCVESYALLHFLGKEGDPGLPTDEELVG